MSLQGFWSASSNSVHLPPPDRVKGGRAEQVAAAAGSPQKAGRGFGLGPRSGQAAWPWTCALLRAVDGSFGSKAPAMSTDAARLLIPQ